MSRWSDGIVGWTKAPRVELTGRLELSGDVPTTGVAPSHGGHVARGGRVFSGLKARLLCPPYGFTTLLLGVYILLGLTAYSVNQFVYHYPGNTYSLDDLFLQICVVFTLITLGIQANFGRYSRIGCFFQDALFATLFFYLLLWGGAQIQYTPFMPIDAHLVRADDALHFHVGEWVTWLHSHPHLKHVLDGIYIAIDLEVIFCFLLVILFRKRGLLTQYYRCMLFSAIMGYTFYYFFPSTAPASMGVSPYFDANQYATGLKFNQIHHYLQPTTLEGGLISFPSFHVIMAWFSAWLTRCWPTVFIVLLVYNACLAASCFLLGWHYFVDIIGSVLMIGLAHYLEKVVR
ncbi:MAG: phosphatase PAP2 family protein [Gammaproteobacteria bacterium]|nr:phosphatase PAP2 family protein [Gammaproteobacteria bacterium]